MAEGIDDGAVFLSVVFSFGIFQSVLLFGRFQNLPYQDSTKRDSLKIWENVLPEPNPGPAHGLWSFMLAPNPGTNPLSTPKGTRY